MNINSVGNSTNVRNYGAVRSSSTKPEQSDNGLEFRRSIQTNLANAFGVALGAEAEVSGEANAEGDATAHFDGRSLNAGVEGEVGASGEIKGGYSIGNDDFSVGAYGRLEGEVGAGGRARVMADRNGGAYVEAGAEASAKAKLEREGSLRVGDSKVSHKKGVNAEALAEANIKYGAATSRQGDEIVSKAGVYGAARAQANVGVHEGISFSSSEGSISGELSVQTGVGVGGAAGAYSEARINTNNWNVKFSSFAELDIEAILEVGVALDLQGETNVRDEVRSIRQELSEYVKNKEAEELKNNQANQNNQTKQTNSKNKIDRNEVRKKILSNIPNWPSKLNVIKQGIKQKMEKIVMGFAKNANEKVRKIMLNGLKPNDNDHMIVKGFKNIASFVVDKTTGLASKAFDITGFIVSRILYHLLFPRIETAVNEIQPTDIIKSS